MKDKKQSKIIGSLLSLVEQDRSLTDDTKLKILEATIGLLKQRKELKP